MNSNHSTNTGIKWSKSRFLAMSFVHSLNVCQSTITAMTICNVGPARENKVSERISKGFYGISIKNPRLVVTLLEVSGYCCIFRLACTTSIRTKMVSLSLGDMVAAYDSSGTISFCKMCETIYQKKASYLKALFVIF